MGETFWRRLVHGVRRLRHEPRWERLAGPQWADRIMTQAVTDRLHVKQGRSIGRLVLESAGERLVVYLKRHYRLPWWSGLAALFRPGGNWSPALQEWEHLAWARAQGLPVPTAAAGGEFVGPWGRLQSFIAIEELTDMLPLHQAVPEAAQVLEPAAFRRWKDGLGREMARLSRELHRRRWFHRDLYFCHFYVAAEDTRRVPTAWPGRVWLIDLHRLGRHPWTWPLRQAKDLAQLLYSSDVPGVTDRDRQRFWRAYRAGKPLGLVERWIGHLIRLRAWNYRRHHKPMG